MSFPHLPDLEDSDLPSYLLYITERSGFFSTRDALVERLYTVERQDRTDLAISELRTSSGKSF